MMKTSLMFCAVILMVAMTSAIPAPFPIPAEELYNLKTSALEVEPKAAEDATADDLKAEETFWVHKPYHTHYAHYAPSYSYGGYGYPGWGYGGYGGYGGYRRYNYGWNDYGHWR